MNKFEFEIEEVAPMKGIIHVEFYEATFLRRIGVWIC